jgi:hypothetical protein
VNGIHELSVDVDATEGRIAAVAVAGDATTNAVVERVGEPRIAKHVPIGTRQVAHLRMRVNEVAAELRPGLGRYARGTYKVTVVHNGATYRLRPRNAYTSRLNRDGMRLGDFRRTSDGVVHVDWFERNRDSVTPTDAAVGYVLAAAFGTGAQYFLVMVLGPVFVLIREALP